MGLGEYSLLTVSSLALLREAGRHPIVRCFPHGALIVFDDDLRYLAAGGLGLNDVGLSRTMLEGRTVGQVFPADVVEVIEPLYRAALAGQESATEVHYQGRLYLQRLAPLRDEAGAIIAGMGFTQDITDVQEAHAALTASERRLREEHRRLEEAQRIGRVGSWEMDLRTGALTWSDAMLRLYGIKPEDFDGDYATALGCVHPEDRDDVDRASASCLATGSDLAVRYRVIRADTGEIRWFSARARTLYDGDEPARLAGAVADVTEQVKAEREAHEAQAFHDAVLAASPDLTVVTDVDAGRVVYVSRREGILGLSSAQLTELTLEERLALVHPDDRDQLVANETAACSVADGQVVQVRYRGVDTDGTWHWMSRHSTPFRRDRTGRVTQLLGIVRDVTDAVGIEERLTHAALHDPLTGLPNRALLIDRLEAAIVEADRDGCGVTVLFCDLDGFKRVNDSFGHAAGDAVLRATAQRLTGVLRSADTVARVGGDEFIVLLAPPSGHRDGEGDHVFTELQLAQHVADRITESLRSPVEVDGTEHTVTVSIGITHSPASTARPSADDLLKDADTAMYRAKTLGKNRSELFRSDPGVGLVGHLR